MPLLIGSRIQYAPDGWLPEELNQLRNVQRNYPFLTIGVPPLRPWAEPCFFSSSHTPSCLAKPGLGIEFTSAVCERLGLTCDFKPLNWTWTGNGPNPYSVDPQAILKEAILSKEFDTSLPLFAIDYTSRSAMYYTLPVFYAEDAVMMKTHLVYPSDDNFLVKPFHPLVWVAVILTLLAVVLADAACRLVAACSRKRRRTEGQNGSFFKLYCRELKDTSIYAAGVLCQRNSSFDQPIVEWSRRLLVFAWGFASVLLCTTYSACLVSRRMAPEIIKPFSNVDEFGDLLLSKSGVRLMAVGHDAYFLRQIENWPSESAHLYKSFRKAVKENTPVYVKNVTLAMEEMEWGDAEEIFLYGSHSTLRALAANDCNVSIIPLGKGQPLSYGFRSSSHHAPLFTKVILNFLEQGYYLERLQEKYGYGRRCESITDQGMVALMEQKQQKGSAMPTVHTLSLQLVFWALLCGYAAGGMALLTEFLHREVGCKGESDQGQRDGEREVTRF